MGKPYSKTEDKEIIIAQTTGAGGNSAGISDQEVHLTTNNILLSVILGFGLLLILYLGYKQYYRCHKKWIHKEMQTSFLRRVRERLSGRRARDEDEEAGPV
ncbi:hypothetical protein O0L34_g8617 [Tuta absoluta]|nr:hypothetical protein O0L34_g8617 [Tuta absoluta]